MPSILLELGKLSPYIVLPALFIFVLWKIYVANGDLIKDLLKEKTEQINTLLTQLSEVNSSANETVRHLEKEMRTQHDKYSESVYSKLDKLETKIDGIYITLNKKQ